MQFGFSHYYFYWIVMEFYPTPEIGAGICEVGKNFASWLDSKKILTGHMWSVTKTWDPRGIIFHNPSNHNPHCSKV